jgi:hypothetical protein
MDLFFAILLCLFFAALIAIGQIYLDMDRQRTRAGVCIAEMKEHLDAWVALTIELTGIAGADPEAALIIRNLADSYYNAKKYRERFARISLANKILFLSGVLVADSACDAEASRILKRRIDASDSLGMLRTEFNQSVRRLNNRLKKKIPAVIGKLFGISILEELYDLSQAQCD